MIMNIIKGVNQQFTNGRNIKTGTGPDYSVLRPEQRTTSDNDDVAQVIQQARGMVTIVLDTNLGWFCPVEDKQSSYATRLNSPGVRDINCELEEIV